MCLCNSRFVNFRTELRLFFFFKLKNTRTVEKKKFRKNDQMSVSGQCLYFNEWSKSILLLKNAENAEKIRY